MIKKILLYIGVFLSIKSHAFAASASTALGTDKITENLKLGGNDLIFTLDNILGFIIGLFYFISIVFAVYAGFTILTSGGDEEKVKKGKKILIYVLVGLIVVFLSSQLIRWVISIMSDTTIVGA